LSKQGIARGQVSRSKAWAGPENSLGGVGGNLNVGTQTNVKQEESLINDERPYQKMLREYFGHWERGQIQDKEKGYVIINPLGGRGGGEKHGNLPERPKRTKD